MTNRIVTILLIVLTTAALFGEAGRNVMEPEGRWQQWLQVLVAQQVADTLDREVQVGPITDISLQGVTASSLAVAEDEALEDGAVIRAEKLRIAFDLPAIVHQEVAPAAGISSVRLEGAWVHAVRDPHGDLNVQKLVPEPVGPPPPPEERFQGVVRMVDSTIVYDDYAVDTLTGGPLNIGLTEIDAEIDMRKIGWAAVDLTARERLGRFGGISLQGQTEFESGFAWARADVDSIDAAYWFDTLVETAGLDVQRGLVDVSGTFGMIPDGDGEAERSVAADVTIRRGALTLAALGGRQIRADGQLTGTLDGAQIHRLEARSEGVRMDVSGYLGDWENLTLDTSFDGEVTRPSELLELVADLGPEAGEQIEGLDIGGPLLLSGRMTGPIEQANISAQIEAPGEVRYANADVGEIAAGPIDLRVDVLDVTDPNVRGRARIARADAPDLEPLQAALPEEMEGPIEVAPLEDVGADVLWSEQIPVAQTDLSVPRVAVGEMAVEGLRTSVAMADDVIYLRNLQAEPLGGRLTADAVLDIGGEEGPWAWARGTLDGFDLARLGELPGLEAAEQLRGDFSGTFAGEFAAGAPEGIANVVVDAPAYQQYSVESLRALVTVDEEGVEVRGAGFQDPMGVGRVRAVVPFEGDMAASFSVVGADLAIIAERFDLGVEGLAGEVFLSGSASGTPDDPQVDATLRGFNVAYEDYEVDAIQADVVGGMDEVAIRDLYASSGRIMARVDGTLSAIDLEEPDAALDGTVQLAGPVDQNTLKLADMSEEDIVAAVEARFDVGGTLKKPIASGEVALNHARYETLATDDAVLAMSLQGDVLQMTQLRVPLADATVTGAASVTSLFDNPIVSATLRAENVILQDLAPLQDMGLPLSGRVDLPYLNVQGPLDGLKGLAQIEATELQVGNENIGAVSTAIVLDQNALMLRRTNVALAAGQLALEGSYRLDTQRIMPFQVALKNVAISELLQVAVPLARFAQGTEEAEEESLAKQLASLSMRIGGRLDGTLSVEGQIPEQAPANTDPNERIRRALEAFDAEVDVSVRDPSFDNKPLPRLALTTRVEKKPEVALQLEATEGDALITADGTWAPGGDVELLTQVSSFNVARLRPWVPGAFEGVGGRLNLTVQTTGSLEEPQFMGSIDVIEPEAHGVKFDLISAPIIRYDGDVVDVDSLVVRESEEEFFVDGQIPLDWDTKSVPRDAPLEVVLRSDGTDLAIFPPAIADALSEPGRESPLSQVAATGTLDSLVKIAGTMRRPELNGEVHVDAPAIETPWLGSPIEDISLNVSFTGVEGKTVVDLKQMAARVESTSVTASGSAEMAEYELARLAENTYDLNMSVEAPKQRLGSDGMALRNVGGEVSFATAEPGRHRLTIDDVGADLGDGRVFIDGTVDVTTFDPEQIAQNDFDVRIVADRARPRYGNFFLGTADGEIAIRNAQPGEPVAMEGGITLSHAVIGIPPMGGREEGPGLHGMPSSFPLINFDVALAIGPDVRVKTTGLTAPLEPTEKAVWLRGTPQRPTVQGLVEVQEGEADISGGVLDVQTAGVRFLVRPRLGGQRKPPVELEMDGRVWATATRTIEQAYVGGRQLDNVLVQLQVSGTLPDHIHVQVSSTPPLAEEQIYAMLGTAPFSGGGLGKAGDLEDVMTEQFVSALGAAFRHYVFQPFQEDLKQLFGLSVFEVSFAFDQPVDVRLGGYLIEDLLVTYETSVIGETESDYELAVSYKVQRRFELTYETTEESDNRFLVEYVYEF